MMKKRNLRFVKQNVIAYSFILPFLFFLFMFYLFPILKVMQFSFLKTGIFTIDPPFVGIQNYLKVLQTTQYSNAFINNIYYILLEVPSCIGISLTLALLLRKQSKVSGIFETVFFLPMLLSMAAAAIVVAYIFALRGPVNYVVTSLGFNPINWLGKTGNARISILFLELWKGSAFFIFTFMVALRAIPSELEDAAIIDGAGLFRRIFFIILPLIKNTILLNVVMTTIWQLQIFESVFLLTGGGPLKTTETIVYNIFQLSFKYDNIGTASAMAVLFMLAILLISLMQMRILRSDIEY